MRHFALSLIGSAAALAFALPAQADSVSFPGFSHGSETVTFTVSAPNVNKTEAVNAGGFSTILNGGPSFTTYCVDLYQTINFGAAPYTEYTGPDTSHLFTNNRAYTDLGRLYATAGAVTTAVQEAAFQIAVWEIAYEDSATPYNLSSGSASFSGGTAASSGALGLASNWLTHLASSGPAITVLQSSLHQDVIYAPVPEASTLAMMVAGLLGLGALTRRRGLNRGFPRLNPAA